MQTMSGGARLGQLSEIIGRAAATGGQLSLAEIYSQASWSPVGMQPVACEIVDRSRLLRRATVGVLLVVSLVGCNSATGSSSSPTTTAPGVATNSGRQPGVTSGSTAPGSGQRLNVVHAPRRVFDDAHLLAGKCHVRQTADGPLPDPTCTPGAIDPAVNQSNIKTTICTPGYTATVRPPAADTDNWKRVTEGAYGVTSGEYDHLVPLELGGANATSNLWVEPGPIPNPKDKVENRLRSEVCAGHITLAAAQQAIANNWTTAP